MGLDNPGTSSSKWVKALWSGLMQILFSNDFPDLLVLEVGAGAPGDIRKIATWLRPDISVFTRLAETPVHIEFFESKEQLYAEKKSLAEHTKQDGLVLYNADDELLESVLADIVVQKEGFSPEGEIVFTKEGTMLQGEDKVTLPGVLGFQVMYPVAALIKIYIHLGIDIQEGLKSLAKEYIPTPGRARIIKGFDQMILIDDAYNASPVAVEAALDVLEKFDASGRKLFVFGDMMELGDYAEKAHVDVAVQAGFVHELITVGELSIDTHKRAMQLGTPTKHFKTSVEAGEYLIDSHQEGDTILFKSSRHAIKMEQAIVQLSLPEEHHKLVQEYL